jgi:YVTN family beta-propeller protein
VTARPHAADAPYQKVKEIQIGGDGGWDYLHVDSTARRLYVSHATKVIVVDLVKDEVVGEIADTPGVHGVVAGANGRIYTSNGREARVSVVDARTLKTIQKVETAPNPDFIMYEPSRQEVYAFNASGSATVIDTAGVVTATIPLGGKPEAAVVDATEGLAYVNIEDKNEIAVVDIARHEVTARWSIAPGQAAAGLALDAHTHRLFIGAHNKLMLMMDSHTGQILSQVTIGTGVDSTWFDPGTAAGSYGADDGESYVETEQY